MLNINPNERVFDCSLRVLRFPKLFVVVDYIPVRGWWEAHIYNATRPEIPKAPSCVVRHKYKDLLDSITLFELLEQNGGLQ